MEAALVTYGGLHFGKGKFNACSKGVQSFAIPTNGGSNSSSFIVKSPLVR